MIESVVLFEKKVVLDGVQFVDDGRSMTGLLQNLPYGGLLQCFTGVHSSFWKGPNPPVLFGNQAELGAISQFFYDQATGGVLLGFLGTENTTLTFVAS